MRSSKAGKDKYSEWSFIVFSVVWPPKKTQIKRMEVMSRSSVNQGVLQSFKLGESPFRPNTQARIFLAVLTEDAFALSSDVWRVECCLPMIDARGPREGDILDCGEEKFVIERLCPFDSWKVCLHRFHGVFAPPRFSFLQPGHFGREDWRILACSLAHSRFCNNVDQFKRTCILRGLDSSKWGFYWGLQEGNIEWENGSIGEPLIDGDPLESHCLRKVQRRARQLRVYASLIFVALRPMGLLRDLAKIVAKFVDQNDDEVPFIADFFSPQKVCLGKVTLSK